MLQIHDRKISAVRAGMLQGHCGAMTPLFLTTHDGLRVVEYLQGIARSFSWSEVPSLLDQITALRLPADDEMFGRWLDQIEPTGRSEITIARGQIRGDVYVAAFPVREGRPMTDAPIYSLTQAIEFARVWFSEGRITTAEVIHMIKGLHALGLGTQAPQAVLRVFNTDEIISRAQLGLRVFAAREFTGDDLALMEQIAVRKRCFKTAFPGREYEAFPGL
ncbi:MAG TPA: hypothetical protein DCS29_02285 [Candidatus Magasanikbacteria bacterium]|nr:hypothetical protein [Candidatus Magasanikbacteria bacterium]